MADRISYVQESYKANYTVALICTIGVIKETLVAFQLRPDTNFVLRAQLLSFKQLWLNTRKIIIWAERYPRKKKK